MTVNATPPPPGPGAPSGPTGRASTTLRVRTIEVGERVHTQRDAQLHPRGLCPQESRQHACRAVVKAHGQPSAVQVL